jgi:hypothetical protein
MLKRTGYIFIMLLLLFGTTGVTITRHYCGNHLVQISIYSTPHNCCNGHCSACHNERIKFRVTDKFETSQSQVNFNAGFKNLLTVHSLPVILAFSETSVNAVGNDAQGDHSIKPYRVQPFYAGHSTAFLQVFLV